MPTRKLIKQAGDNTRWGQNRKCTLGPKEKTQAEANVENTRGAHYESPDGGGRPKAATIGEGRPKAAAHHAAR